MPPDFTLFYAYADDLAVLMISYSCTTTIPPQNYTTLDGYSTVFAARKSSLIARGVTNRCSNS